MNASLLEDIGLTVRETGKGLEAELELVGGPLVNPMTRQFISKVSFSSAGERLEITAPPELVGTPALSLARVEKASDLESQLHNQLNELVLHVQRRSADLQALGLSPRVDPKTLELTAEVPAGAFVFTIASDKQGHFRVARAARAGKKVPSGQAPPFDLSEFREKPALVGYLLALFSEPQPSPAAPAPQGQGERPVSFSEVFQRFGAGALLPATSSLELLVELRVNGALYRFAAARVTQRTFRGLLAGSAGKLWAERFELEQFPGVVPLVAKLLGVAPDKVEVLSAPGEK